MNNEQGVPDWMLWAAQDAAAAEGSVPPFIRAAEVYMDEVRKAHAAGGPIRGYAGIAELIADRMAPVLDLGMADLIAAYRRQFAFRDALAPAGLASAIATAGDVGVATVTPPPAALSREAFLTWLAVLVGLAFLMARADLSAEAQNAILYYCGVIGVVLGFIPVIRKR